MSENTPEPAYDLTTGLETEATLRALLDELDRQYKSVRAANGRALLAAHARSSSTAYDVTAPGGKKAADVRLKGFTGTVAAVADEAAVLAFVREHFPTEIVPPKLTPAEIRPAFLGGLLKQCDKAQAPRVDVPDPVTGEVTTVDLPGVVMNPKARSHEVAFVGGKNGEGRRLIAESWRGVPALKELLPPADPA